MKKYQIIYADPPWQQTRGGRKSVRSNSSGMSLPYSVIALSEIDKFIGAATALVENDSILFLWTIDKYLFEAEAIGKRHGYRLHARMIWNKITGIPTAFTIRFGHEYLLYMYRGKLIPVALDQRGKWHSVFTERVVRHSQKPVIAYEIIESLYPNATRLEMFARSKRKGWDVWGNEVESDIELANVTLTK